MILLGWIAVAFLVVVIGAAIVWWMAQMIGREG